SRNSTPAISIYRRQPDAPSDLAAWLGIARTSLSSIDEPIDKSLRALDGDIPVAMLAELLLVIQLDGPLPAVSRQCPHKRERYCTMSHGKPPFGKLTGPSEGRFRRGLMCRSKAQEAH